MVDWSAKGKLFASIQLMVDLLVDVVSSVHRVMQFLTDHVNTGDVSCYLYTGTTLAL